MNQLLDKKDGQVANLMQMNNQLKGYAADLKTDLERKYTAEGKVMPRELQESPVALSPRNQSQI